jgi:nondiscriminating glutamyl-tRNA synthetase
MSARVRLALHPGAPLSIAQARTALFNWLFVRRHGGAFILYARDVGLAGPAAEDGAPGDELRWLGLDWDEGPCAESTRLDLYRACAHELLRQGRAYRDPVAPESHPGAPVHSPGAPVVRLEIPRPEPGGYDAPMTDAVPYDPILLDARGRPTALLRDVVDDHDAAVTHVIGPAEEQPGASLQIALYRALGWQAPSYAYLPPIVDRESGPGSHPGSRLLNEVRRQGYLPLAVANHLARLGWTPRGKRRLLTLPELAARFELERVSHSPAPFDAEQLDWFNHRCLRRLDEAELARLWIPRWQQAYGAAHVDGTTLAPDEWQRLLVTAIRDEVYRLDQAVDKARFAFAESICPDARAGECLAQPYAAEVLRAFADELSVLEPFEYDEIDARVSALRLRFKASHGIRSRDVMFVLRAALTGRMDGPCLIVACQLLGRRRCIARASHHVVTWRCQTSRLG